MSILNAKIFKNLSAYFISSLITALISLLINPFLASKLSHSDYAIIGYYSSIALLLVPIVSLSLQSYYARNYFLVDEDKRLKIYNTLLTLFSTLGWITFIFFFVLYYIYHKFCNVSIEFSPYAFLTFLPVLLSSYYNLYLMDLRMRAEGGKYAVVAVSNSVIASLFSILLVYVLNYGAIGRLCANLITALLFAFYSLLAKKIRFSWDKKIILDALSFCWPLIITGILSFFFLGVDRVMLERLEDSHNLGLYNVGIQISGYLGIFGTVLLQTFDPDIYRYTSRAEHKKVILLCLTVITAVLIPNLIFILCSKPIIYLLTAGKYVDSYLFANILCLKNVTTTFAYMMSGVLIGYGLSKYELLNRAIGAFLSVVLYSVLISHFEFYGAAWGQGISWLLMGIISILCLLIVLRKNAKAQHNTAGL